MVGHPVINYRPSTPFNRASSPAHRPTDGPSTRPLTPIEGKQPAGKRTAPLSTEKSPFKPNPKRKRLSVVAEGIDWSDDGSEDLPPSPVLVSGPSLVPPVPPLSAPIPPALPAGKPLGVGFFRGDVTRTARHGRRFVNRKRKKILLVKKDGSAWPVKELRDNDQEHHLQYPIHPELDDVYLWHEDRFYALHTKQAVTTKSPQPISLPTSPPFLSLIIKSTGEQHLSLQPKGKGKKKVNTGPTVERAVLTPEEAQGIDPRLPVGAKELISLQTTRPTTQKRARKLQGEIFSSDDDEDEDEEDDAQSGNEKGPGRAAQGSKRAVTTKGMSAQQISKLVLGPHEDLPPSLKNGNAIGKYIAVMGMGIQKLEIDSRNKSTDSRNRLMESLSPTFTLSDDARKVLKVEQWNASNESKILDNSGKKLENDATRLAVLMKIINTTSDVATIKLALEKVYS